MEAILARRYAFCDFSHIVGFPNLVPDREMWEYCLPRFCGNGFDHPAEHLFDFHECMQRLNIFHEDVLIKMFRNSLEGKAREWCKTLPAASISSLSGFHDIFYSHYKGMYSNGFLFENCCKVFESYYVDKKEFDDEGVEELSLEKCDTHMQEDQPIHVSVDCHITNHDDDPKIISTDVLVVTKFGQHIYKSNQSIINTQSEPAYDSHISEEQINYCWINGDNDVENQKQLSDFYDHPAVFRFPVEISLSEIYQQFHKFIIPPDCIKVSDIPADYSVINPIEIIDGHFVFLDQSTFCCDFCDLVAIYMKSVFSKSSKTVAAFGVLINNNTKCRMKINSLLKFFQNSCIFSDSCDEAYENLITWMHWKFSFT